MSATLKVVLTELMPDCRVWSSVDMVHWRDHGTGVSTKDFAWASGEACAAQYVYLNNKFYFYISLTHRCDSDSKGGISIGVVISASPVGPFKNSLGKALVTNEMTTDKPHVWDDLDPMVFIDADDQACLFWGNGSCKYVKLKKNMIELDGPIYNFTPLNYNEAPWVYKRNGLYYLVYAANFPETIE